MRYLMMVVLLAVGPSAYCQVEIESATVQTIKGTKDVKAFGDVIVFSSGDSTEFANAAVVEVKTEAANVILDVKTVTNQRLMPVPYEQITDNVYLISQPGEHWVEVIVFDGPKNIFGKKSTMVKVEASTPVGPSVPSLPEPSDALKTLVAPIVSKLDESSDRAKRITAAFLGFSDALDSVKMKDVSEFLKVQSLAVGSLDLGGSPSLAADLENALNTHVGFEVKDRAVLNRSLDSEDHKEIAEVYAAVAWAATQ